MFSSQDQWNEKSLLEQQIPQLGWGQKRKEYISLLSKKCFLLKGSQTISRLHSWNTYLYSGLGQKMTCLLCTLMAKLISFRWSNHEGNIYVFYLLNGFYQIVLTLGLVQILKWIRIRHRAIVKILHLSQSVGPCFDSITRNLNRGGYS